VLTLLQVTSIDVPPPPVAANAKPATLEAAQASSKKKDDLVCRTEATLGTRFSKRVCRYRSDMLLQEEAARNATQHIQNEKATFPVGG
jgi:hypothetical protein